MADIGMVASMACPTSQEVFSTFHMIV
jgi:hypothetical protein